MKRLFLMCWVALACVLTVDPVFAQELDVAAKKKLAVAGSAVGKAIATSDIVALEKLWSPKLLVNSPDNTVLTRDQVFAAIRHGHLKYSAGYKVNIEKVEFYGNVAVTMGEDVYTPEFGPDNGKLLHRRSTDIWQYTDGNWVMIARQATIYDPDVKHY